MNRERHFGEDTFEVLVFRSSPVWDTLSAWYYISPKDYWELLVATIQCHDNHAHTLIKQLNEEYPNHYLVYCLPM